MKPIKTALAAAVFAFAASTSVQAQDKPVLTIYTYDSFVSEWGPGPKIDAGFEKVCDCDVNFVAPGDAAEVLSRLRLEGENSKADVIVGLDLDLVAIADQSGLFQPHGAEVGGLSLPVDWDSATYLPYDWGYFSFVYDRNKLANAPTSFEDLINAPEDVTIVIQDPRSSSPGLGLLLWVKSVYGDKAAETWAKLQPRIVTVTKGWWDAYSMFLEGQASMVLSYTTSPAYHLIAEGKDNIKAASFSEGHYLQVELAAMTKSSKHPELASRFLAYLVGDEAQNILPVTNWMYPAKTPSDGLPKGFESLIQPARAIMVPVDEVPAVRKEALDEWLDALSQ